MICNSVTTLTRVPGSTLASVKAFPAMAYAHGLSQTVVAQGQAILEATGKAVGEIKDDFIEFLEEQNLVQKGVLHTDLLLTHPKNRGSLLLNPNNAHRNGSLIRRVGANLGELHGAVSMEMSPNPKRRQDF